MRISETTKMAAMTTNDKPAKKPSEAGYSELKMADASNDDMVSLDPMEANNRPEKWTQYKMMINYFRRRTERNAGNVLKCPQWRDRRVKKATERKQKLMTIFLMRPYILLCYLYIHVKKWWFKLPQAYFSST